MTDFGLAKLAGDEPVTRTGVALGTPAYMAPEQAGGRTKAVGPAADVYALGTILYELLTGRPPFRGESDVDTLRQVCDADPVPPRHLRPGLARDLGAVCLKCLEKFPGRRYESAAALADDLRRFLAGRPTAARPVGAVGRAARWCRRRPVVAALAAALVVAVGLGIAGVTREYLRAERERDSAVAERDRGARLLGQAHDTLDKLHALGAQVARNSQSHALGRDIQAELLRYSHALLAEAADNPGVRRAAARAAVTAAETLTDQARYAEAAASCRQAADLYADLLAADPGDPELGRGLGDAHLSLGTVHFKTREPDAARAAYRSAAAAYGQLAAGPAATAEDVRHHLLAGLNEGLIDKDYVGWEAGVQSIGQVVEQLRAAVKRYPDDRGLRLDLAMGLDWVSAAYTDAGRWADAEGPCRDGLTLRRELYADRPTSRAARWGLAVSCSRMGRVLSGKGDTAGADALYAEATQIYEKTLAAAPDAVQIQKDYAEHLTRNHARLAEALGRLADAAAKYRSAAAARAQLARLQPTVARHPTDQAEALYHAARTARLAGDADRARQAAAQARRVLAAAAPAADQTDARRRIAAALDALDRKTAAASGDPTK